MNWNDFKKNFYDCNICDGKIVIKSNLYDVINFVKSNYTYQMLKEIIAIDRQDAGIELVYHLYSVEDEETLMIAIVVKDSIDSIVDIFPSAQADENEIYDLFGIKFIGNNDLKRLYMPESWSGHPLKKDYVQNDERLIWNDEEHF